MLGGRHDRIWVFSPAAEGDAAAAAAAAAAVPSEGDDAVSDAAGASPSARVIATREELRALIAALRPEGRREGALRDALERLQPQFEAAMVAGEDD